MIVYEVVGWAGTIAILMAYFLVSTKKIEPEEKMYQLMNLFGALGIVVNSAVHDAVPSAGLNIAWMLIAVYGLLQTSDK